MICLRVSKTVSLDAEDIVKIQKSIEKGYAENLSDFIQRAVKNYLATLAEGVESNEIQKNDR